MDDKFYSFEKAREYVRTLNLKGLGEWLQYTKTTDFPDFLPKQPEQVYKEEWTGFGSWLGTTRRYSTNFLSFEESREYARGLNISSIAEWEALCREGKMPQNIPSCPDLTFSSKWITWYDWLGTVQEE